MVPWEARKIPKKRWASNVHGKSELCSQTHRVLNLELAVWPWASHWHSLQLNFLICTRIRLLTTNSVPGTCGEVTNTPGLPPWCRTSLEKCFVFRIKGIWAQMMGENHKSFKFIRIPSTEGFEMIIPISFQQLPTSPRKFRRQLFPLHKILFIEFLLCSSFSVQRGSLFLPGDVSIRWKLTNDQYLF